MLPKIASEKPRIINTKKLKKASLEALLADPHMLTPPELGVGEFLAGMLLESVGPRTAHVQLYKCHPQHPNQCLRRTNAQNSTLTRSCWHSAKCTLIRRGASRWVAPASRPRASAKLRDVPACLPLTPPSCPLLPAPLKASQLGEIMAELGADWDEDELGEAEQAMDPTGSGTVSYDTFKGWWLN